MSIQNFETNGTYVPTEYELARAELAEKRIAANLAALDGQTGSADSLPASPADIKELELRVRLLAESSSDVQLRFQ